MVAFQEPATSGRLHAQRAYRRVVTALSPHHRQVQAASGSGPIRQSAAIRLAVFKSCAAAYEGLDQRVRAFVELIELPALGASSIELPIASAMARSVPRDLWV